MEESQKVFHRVTNIGCWADTPSGKCKGLLYARRSSVGDYMREFFVCPHCKQRYNIGLTLTPQFTKAELVELVKTGKAND